MLDIGCCMLDIYVCIFQRELNDSFIHIYIYIYNWYFTWVTARRSGELLCVGIHVRFDRLFSWPSMSEVFGLYTFLFSSIASYNNIVQFVSSAV
jgi:hypothetical protein